MAEGAPRNSMADGERSGFTFNSDLSATSYLRRLIPSRQSFVVSRQSSLMSN
jgi:hypothetical protein